MEPRMQDKTIAFIGESLGRQQFQSLMCLAAGGKNPEAENARGKYGLVNLFGFQISNNQYCNPILLVSELMRP